MPSRFKSKVGHNIPKYTVTFINQSITNDTLDLFSPAIKDAVDPPILLQEGTATAIEVFVQARLDVRIFFTHTR